MERIHLAEDRVKWKILINTAIIQIQIIQKISWIATELVAFQTRLCFLEKIIGKSSVTDSNCPSFHSRNWKAVTSHFRSPVTILETRKLILVLCFHLETKAWQSRTMYFAYKDAHTFRYSVGTRICRKLLREINV